MQHDASDGLSNDAYSMVIFGVVMLLIMTLGLIGNIATIVVLRQVEHRTKSVSHLMINLAAASVVMCGLGYPVGLISNLKALKLSATENYIRCSWLGLSNAVTGISCILTLALMSVIQHRGVTQISVPSNPTNRLSKKRIALVITAIWVASILLCIPPMFGWNRFVPVHSGVSCHPDWESQDPKDKAYIWFLVTGGFFIPLFVICFSYSTTYRFIRRSSVGYFGGSVENRNLALQKKLRRMITAAILAFILSWSPYCIVSLISTFKGHHVLSLGLSIVPELMAKSSVIYNPIIFTCFNASFRATLMRLTNAFLRKCVPARTV